MGLLKNRTPGSGQTDRRPEITAAELAGMNLQQLVAAASDDGLRPGLRRQARQRLSACLDDSTQTQLAALEPWQTAIFHPQLQQRLAAVQRLTDEDTEALSEVVRQSPCEQAREQALQRLHDPALLRELLRRLRGRDKRCTQQLSSRLQELLEKQQQLGQRQAVQEKLALDFEKLAATADHLWTREQSLRLLHLLRQWQRHQDGAEASLAARVTAAREHCEEVQRQREQAAKRPAQCCQALEEKLQALNEDPDWQPATELVAIDELLQRNRQLWQLSQHETEVDGAVQKRWESLCASAERLLAALGRLGERSEALQSLLDDSTAGDPSPLAPPSDRLQSLKQHAKALDWPPTAPTPQLLRQLAAAIDAIQQQVDAATSEKDSRQFRVEKLLRALGGHINAKRLRVAMAIRRDLDEALKQLTPEERRAIPARLESLDEKLNSLLDWKNHVCKPKLQQLCGQMESLSSAKQPPPQRLAEIRRLRQAWRELGYSPAQDQLKERFELAAKQALSQCTAYLKQQGQLAEANLVQLEQLADNLKNCLQELDPQYPDWAEINAVLDRAERFRRDRPQLPKPAGKELRQQFAELRQALLTQLEPVTKSHEARKETLISEAEALAEQGPTERNLGQSKVLGMAWRQLGRGRNEPALYKRFREAQDKLHLQQRQRRESHQHEQQTLEKQVEAAVAGIAELLKIDDSELQDSQPRFLQFRKDAEQPLAQLPEAQQDRLQRRLNRAAERYEEHYAGLGERRQRQELLLLRQLAQVGQRVAAAKDDSERQQATAKLAELRAQLKNPAPGLEQRLDQLLQGNYSGDAEARRKLCLQIEILAGLPSPPEDSELRMQLQLDTLKHNIGAGRPNRETLLRRSLELQLAWYCEPPTDPDIEAALWPRIEQAVAALEQHQQATAETAKNRSERSERAPKRRRKPQRRQTDKRPRR